MLVSCFLLFIIHIQYLFVQSKIMLDIQKWCFLWSFFLYYEGKIKIKNTNRNFTVHKKDKKMSLQLDKTASLSKNCIIKYSRLRALVRT